ncbi:MAG: hypothetical protein K9M54_02285 [Kiritimatiellales bacterium]|nr:hypothetical protein [Kiritimatiellales bacterium]
MMTKRWKLPAMFLVAICMGSLAADWKPVEGTLMTRWAAEVDANHPLPDYPRPQMARENWINLNGLWNYAIQPKADPVPQSWQDQILVPFCVESALSGVMKPLTPDQKLWYRRTFRTPDMNNGKRLLLHFGAVDWESQVWVNGVLVGSHKGGHDPFSLDITKAITNGSNEVIVSVWDPTDTDSYPRGKQSLHPKGIWYTAVSGIWQTVWLETVPDCYISSLNVQADTRRVTCRVSTGGSPCADGETVQISVMENGQVKAAVEGQPGETISINVPEAKQWSPQNPFLYDLHVEMKRDGKRLDRVTSYFGMRTIEVRPDDRGQQRLFLNGRAVFQLGLLDQGWWPDGLYTAPTDDALRYDIEITKRLGFNMIRKHAKTEPDRWYYWCDRLGLLVWQDMPSGTPDIWQPGNLWVRPEHTEEVQRSPESAEQFNHELMAIIDAFRNHPSIIMWVPFNEGWGQHDAVRTSEKVKRYDPSRLVNAHSGWLDLGAGDLMDIHHYPGPGIELAKGRASVLGEFGGLGLPVTNHLWGSDRNWGYQTLDTASELATEYKQLIQTLYSLTGLGMAAAVYTQTTDVEGEVNGLMTYDRAIIKLDESWLRDVNSKLYGPPATTLPMLLSSEKTPQTWKYRIGNPPDGWEQPGFTDLQWLDGPAPFADKKNPFYPLGTLWPEKKICMRRNFQLTKIPPMLTIQTAFNLDDLEVYINGVKVLDQEKDRDKLRGHTSRHYQFIDISEHVSALKTGANVIAVKARKNAEERLIDIGLYGTWPYPMEASTCSLFQPDLRNVGLAMSMPANQRLFP